MTHQSKNIGQFTIAEMREFGTFPAQAQRYIRRSLDVALNKDAIAIWSRDATEMASIKAQSLMYQKLIVLKEVIPKEFSFTVVEAFMSPLVTISAFDLGQGKLSCFSSYRFLYERLLGASARQWLPSSFCAAAALPHLHPDRRKNLLTSISEAAATAPGWSTREPTFFPEWVEKIK